jgi:hypothetical protein
MIHKARSISISLKTYSGRHPVDPTTEFTIESLAAPRRKGRREARCQRVIELCGRDRPLTDLRQEPGPRAALWPPYCERLYLASKVRADGVTRVMSDDGSQRCKRNAAANGSRLTVAHQDGHHFVWRARLIGRESALRNRDEADLKHLCHIRVNPGAAGRSIVVVRDLGVAGAARAVTPGANLIRAGAA